jgi:hypothetical protein
MCKIDSPSLAGPAVLLFLTTALVACSDRNPTTPGSETSSCGGGTVTLAALQGARFDCSAGTSIQLAGNGASYLVVPQFATDDADNRAVSFMLGGGSTASAVAAAAAAANTRRNMSDSAGTGLRQRAFDARMMASARAAVSRGQWRVGSTAVSRSVQSVPPPALNTIRQFAVLSAITSTIDTYTAVGARLVYVGDNVLVYVDTLAPPNGFSDAALQGVGRLFDQTLYPIDLNAFGQSSDIDQNGRLIMLMSPVVNALTPSSACASQGFTAGFFNGADLIDTSTVRSNRGEVFYTIVPDPSGSVSCAHSVDALLRDVPAVFLHELQHLISFSQHVVVHGGAAEDGWLDEGMSIVAEELGSLYYEARFPPPSGRTNPAQLFPDSSQGFISGALLDSYAFLRAPSGQSVTLHSDSDDGLEWRGGDWALLRWLGDQKGGTAFYKQLEDSRLTGAANIAAAAGESFQSLFGDFSLSLYTDSLPGTPRSQVPARNRFVTRNLRQMYQALYNASNPDPDIPQPFPISTTALSATSATTASMVPGTMIFFRLDTPPGTATVSIRFATPAGQPLPASLHPQLSVFRLPN